MDVRFVCRPALLFALSIALAAPLMAHTQQDSAGSTPLGSPHVYETIDGHEEHVYLATPDAKAFPGLRPVLVTIHGGGFTAGNASSFNPQAEYFLRRGMISAEVEYRLLEKGASSLEDQIRDVRAAVRWVKAHAAEYHGDSNKVVLMGGSAGGYLVEANILLDGPDAPGSDAQVTTIPFAAVLFNPVLNGEPGAKFHRLMVDHWRDLSPYSRVSKNQPPTITLIGADDTTVGVPDTVEFVRRLKAAGVRSELYIFPGEAHGFFNHDPYVAATLVPIDEFLTSLGLLAPSNLPAATLAPEKRPIVTR